MENRENWSLTWYDNPRKADEDDRAYYRSLTPQQRLDIMVDLLNRWGKLNELRIEKVIEIVDCPRPEKPK